MGQQYDFIKESSKISVKEIQDLVKEVKEFYAERNNPRQNIIWLADMIIKRLRNDFDFYANCEGTKGIGKSNFILLLALMQCRYAGIWKNKKTGEKVRVFPRTTPLSSEWEHIEVEFDFSKNMSFLDNVEDVKQKYYTLSKFQPFVIDEGSKNLHKYGWQSKMQFMLIQMSDTERYQNKAFYINFPNFRELNSVFRNDRVRMRLYVFSRSSKNHSASVIVSLRDVNRFILDPWHTDENAKMFEHYLRRVPAAMRTPRHILNAEKKLKGYAGNFDFPELKKIAPRIWKIYMKYKIENAKKEMVDVEVEKEKSNVMRWKYATKMLLAYLKKKHPDLVWADYARLTDVSNVTLNELWRTKIEKENQKETMDKAKELLESGDSK